MVRDPEKLTAYDARCYVCDEVHIVWLHGGHEPGDSVGYAHVDKPGACGKYAEHTIVAKLPEIEHSEAEAGVAA